MAQNRSRWWVSRPQTVRVAPDPTLTHFRQVSEPVYITNTSLPVVIGNYPSNPVPVVLTGPVAPAQTPIPVNDASLLAAVQKIVIPSGSVLANSVIIPNAYEGGDYLFSGRAFVIGNKEQSSMNSVLAKLGWTDGNGVALRRLALTFRAYYASWTGARPNTTSYVEDVYVRTANNQRGLKMFSICEVGVDIDTLFANYYAACDHSNRNYPDSGNMMLEVKIKIVQ